MMTSVAQPIIRAGHPGRSSWRRRRKSVERLPMSTSPETGSGSRPAGGTRSGGSAFRTVRTPRAADLVGAQLRRHIIGDMSDGETLPPESVLMERFGVARQTLREAFRVLE